LPIRARGCSGNPLRYQAFRLQQHTTYRALHATLSPFVPSTLKRAIGAASCCFSLSRALMRNDVARVERERVKFATRWQTHFC
jgi:hypothetical protein